LLVAIILKVHQVLSTAKNFIAEVWIRKIALKGKYREPVHYQSNSWKYIPPEL
jgi:hypothetical protein